jgi:hypothetical protein
MRFNSVCTDTAFMGFAACPTCPTCEAKARVLRQPFTPLQRVAWRHGDLPLGMARKRMEMVVEMR